MPTDAFKVRSHLRGCGAHFVIGAHEFGQRELIFALHAKAIQDRQRRRRPAGVFGGLLIGLIPAEY